MNEASETRQSARAFRVALIASLALHLLLGAVAFHAFDTLARLARLAEKPKEREIVMISSAIRIERRARPVPVARASRSRARAHSRPPRVAHRPVPHPPAAVAQAQLPVPVGRPVAVAAPRSHVEPHEPKPELAQRAPTAPPALPTAPPTARPQSSKHAPRQAPPRLPAEQRVAELEHPPAIERPPQQPANSGTYSEEQLQQIQRDLEKTIAEARTANDPLRAVPKETPAAPKRYHIQMEGRFGDLRYGQGYYYPIRGWRSGGLDYYYVSYEFTWADGTYETGSVPWPIHFEPARDPFENPGLGERTPLPPPPPGFAPPPNLGKALRPFFPGYGFSGSG